LFSQILVVECSLSRGAVVEAQQQQQQQHNNNSMKLTHKKLKPGMTLIELTVVIIVLLTLISVLFFAGTAYIKASNRTACLTNQATIQKAMRGYATLNQIVPTGSITWTTIKADGYIGGLPSTMKCPTNKNGYVALNKVPAQGTLVAPCPDITALTDHVATDITNY